MTTKKKILIVEDEKPLAHALQLKIESEGMSAQIAENGEECLKMLAGEHFDILLLDLMMPVMDGFQVLRELKTKPGPKTYVIVLSNLSVHDDQKRALAAGAQKYFVKSDVSLSKLIEEIKAV